jgi:hypothetical protein
MTFVTGVKRMASNLVKRFALECTLFQQTTTRWHAPAHQQWGQFLIGFDIE